MKILKYIAVLSVFLFAAMGAEAKLLPQAAKKATGGKTYSAPVIRSNRPYLRADRRALILPVSGLAAGATVDYTLSYKTNGMDQGVRGSVSSSEGSTSREMLFGTCSSGVCTYHQNITDMTLEVATTQSSGAQATKRYKVKP